MEAQHWNVLLLRQMESETITQTETVLQSNRF